MNGIARITPADMRYLIGASISVLHGVTAILSTADDIPNQRHGSAVHPMNTVEYVPFREKTSSLTIFRVDNWET